MLARVKSLRQWLLVAMVTSAVIGLGGAFLLEESLEHSSERSGDTANALSAARTVATQARDGASVRRLAALQALLGGDRLTVKRGGATVFQGPPPPPGRPPELQEQVPFPGGAVMVQDYSPPDSTMSVDVTLITAGVLALVIIAGIVTATLVTRAVRGPVGRAIDAAEQLSHGQLSARMGASGPEELVKLGRAFDGMAARLERADRDQRQFLADVAHEIATPLNTISGFGLALADGAIDTDARRAEAGALIKTETARLLDLLTDLRELTRLDLTEGVRLAPVALTSFAHELVARFAPAAVEAGLELGLDVRANEIRSDRRLLDTVVSNLLSNAIRYTPSGGRVEVQVRQHRDRLVLAVRDNGIGIAAEHQQRIFERLYRVDGARARATGGSGLGLAIAQRAAHSLGGYLELESSPGEGSEFRLVLPRVSERAAAPADVTSAS